MNLKIILILIVSLYPIVVNGGEVELLKRDDLEKVQLATNSQESIGKPGLIAKYGHESDNLIRGSVVKILTLGLGPLEEKNGTQFQWLHLQATKVNGEQFSIWILTDRYPTRFPRSGIKVFHI